MGTESLTPSNSSHELKNVLELSDSAGKTSIKNTSTISRSSSSARLSLTTGTDSYKTVRQPLDTGRVAPIKQNQLVDKCRKDVQEAIDSKTALSAAAKKRATTMKTWGVACLVLGILVIGAAVAATALFPPAGLGLIMGAMLLGAMGVGFLAVTKSGGHSAESSKKPNAEKLDADIGKLTRYKAQYDDPAFASYVQDHPHLAHYDRIDELHGKYLKVKAAYEEKQRILDKQNALEEEELKLLNKNEELQDEMDANPTAEDNDSKRSEIDKNTARLAKIVEEKEQLKEATVKNQEVIEKIRFKPEEATPQRSATAPAARSSQSQPAGDEASDVNKIPDTGQTASSETVQTTGVAEKGVSEGVATAPEPTLEILQKEIDVNELKLAEYLEIDFLEEELKNLAEKVSNFQPKTTSQNVATANNIVVIDDSLEELKDSLQQKSQDLEKLKTAFYEKYQTKQEEVKAEELEKNLNQLKEKFEELLKEDPDHYKLWKSLD